MSQRTLQHRIATVEARLLQVEEQMRGVHTRAEKDWRRAVEKYAGDDDLLTLFRDAQHLREAERRRASAKRPSSRRKSK